MPAKWHPDRLPPGLRTKNGIHWVAPGSVTDQPDYADYGTVVKALHAMQDEGGYWYVTREMGDGSVEVGARDIHYLTDVIEDMRHSARNLPGLEVWIDNPHREEGTDDREINRDYQKPVVTRHARLARRKAKT